MNLLVVTVDVHRATPERKTHSKASRFAAPLIATFTRDDLPAHGELTLPDGVEVEIVEVSTVLRATGKRL